jgi:hypothetical protein
VGFDLSAADRAPRQGQTQAEDRMLRGGER